MKFEEDGYLKGYAWIDTEKNDVFLKIARSYMLLGRIFEKLYKKNDISESKFNALFLLATNEDGLLLSELGEKMMMTKAGITKLVDGLEKEGLVKRYNHPTDRRSILAKNTEAGLAIYKNMGPEIKALLNEIVAGLSEEERACTVDLLDKYYNNLVEVIGNMPEEI